MTQEQIEGNKLIAAFIGASKITDFSGDETFNIPSMDAKWYYAEDLKYHRSWDWLMAAIQKIKRLNVTEFGEEKVNDFLHQKRSVTDMSISIDLDLAFIQVVDFLKWFNTQSK